MEYSVMFLENSFNVNLAPVTPLGLKVSKPEPFKWSDIFSTQYLIPLAVPATVFMVLMYQSMKKSKIEKP